MAGFRHLSEKEVLLVGYENSRLVIGGIVILGR
jgi:hypothetical protein